MTKVTKKQEKVWAYRVKHPKATTKQIAEATNSSVSYVHKLMSKIGTSKEVLGSAYVLTDEGKAVSVSRGTEFDGYALNPQLRIGQMPEWMFHVKQKSKKIRYARSYWIKPLT